MDFATESGCVGPFCAPTGRPHSRFETPRNRWCLSDLDLRLEERNPTGLKLDPKASPPFDFGSAGSADTAEMVAFTTSPLLMANLPWGQRSIRQLSQGDSPKVRAHCSLSTSRQRRK